MELVFNKIPSLKPFEGKVLVRNENTEEWKPAIFGCYINNETTPYCVLGGICWKQCIPYEGHENFLGKNKDYDSFHKN